MKRFVVLLLLLLALVSGAAAIGVSPAGLEFEAGSEGGLVREVFVTNNEVGKVDFEVYSDSDMLKAVPSSFSVQPGETKRVAVKLLAEKVDRTFDATVFVVSGSLENLNLRTGAKLPVKIEAGVFGNKVPASSSVRENNESEEVVESDSDSTAATGLFAMGAQYVPFGILILGIIALAFVFARKSKALKGRNNYKK